MSVATIENTTAQASAAGVLRLLPATDLVAGEPMEGAAAVATAVPGAGAKAVSARLSGGVSGTVVISVSAQLAAQIENGPLGPQDFLAALTPGLDDVVATLSQSHGPTQHEAGQALDAEIALSSAGNYPGATTIAFTSPAGLAGSLVLLLEDNTGVANFDTFANATVADGALRGVELLSDVEMGVTAELGRTRMTVRELLSLQPGSIVELDRAAGSPVDLLVNGTLVARGEVVVIDEEFGVRVTEIIGYDAKRPN